MWPQFLGTFLFSFTFLVAVRFVASANKCEACESLVGSFLDGLKKTEKAHFAGGNTAWESEKLGKYSRSETRLVEIMEGTCKKGSGGKDMKQTEENMCHSFAEENEEHVENWYFHKQTSNKDFRHWLCIETVQVCCPGNTWGPDCEPCPGEPDRPCFGNGKCSGVGTREGTGKCQCNKGYIGKLCRKCSTNYYSSFSNDTHSNCTECDKACKGGCSGPGASKCNNCKDGWELTDDAGCVDIDECANNNPCTGDFEACENKDGSYSCACQEGYKKEDGKCVVDEEAKAALNRQSWTSPENILRMTSAAGLLLCLILILQRRSYGLGAFYAVIMSIVMFIEFGPGSNMIANQTAGIDAETLMRAMNFPGQRNN